MGDLDAGGVIEDADFNQGGAWYRLNASAEIAVLSLMVNVFEETALVVEMKKERVRLVGCRQYVSDIAQHSPGDNRTPLDRYMPMTPEGQVRLAGEIALAKCEVGVR
ncbi:hypothetical protein [Thiocapsa imhoffii]|uniref:hypothetical protein n=1 Tax=Thiocapsa imhoffii TaxID=382777 RepID=UPI001907A469|nr:hypothetical protein [Thiocapsa imhoffii]